MLCIQQYLQWHIQRHQRLIFWQISAQFETYDMYHPKNVSVKFGSFWMKIYRDWDVNIRVIFYDFFKFEEWHVWQFGFFFLISHAHFNQSLQIFTHQLSDDLRLCKPIFVLIDESVHKI